MIEHLCQQGPPAVARPLVLFYKRPAPGAPQQGGPAPPAAELYKAASSDADTFQAALLIPEVRKKIEAVLGRKLSDTQLRALIDNTRAEAVYWYARMTQSQPARDTARPAPGGCRRRRGSDTRANASPIPRPRGCPGPTEPT